MGKLWIFFELIFRRGRRGFPLGLELKSLQWIWILARKNGILVATGPGPRQIEVSNSGYAIKPKKSVKRQTDTKTQWNTLQVSVFFWSFRNAKTGIVAAWVWPFKFKCSLMDIYRSLASAWKTLSGPLWTSLFQALWAVAPNGERRKTNVKESKRERVGGPFALSP